MKGDITMKSIETKRLILRAFTLEDWSDVRELALDWSKAPGPAFDKLPTSHEETKELTAFFAESDQYLAVYLRETKKVIGLIALNKFDENQRLDVGHIILGKYQDNDIDQEALGAAVDYVFESKGTLAILTHNAPEHDEQIAPLKSMGFKNTNQEDMGEFVLTKVEWEKRKS